MFDNIRKYTQGWTAWILLSFIIIIFVALGLDGFMGSLNMKGSGKINLYGEEVTPQQLQAFKELFGADFTGLAAQIGYLKQKGFYISDEQIDNAITNSPEFQTNGGYDPQKFSKLLHGNESYIQAYRDYLAYQLYTQQQYSVFSFANLMPKWQLDDWYQILNQTRDFAVIKVSYKNYLNNFKISDKEAEEFYKNNSFKYIESEKVKIQYINLSAQTLKVNNPTDKQLENYYQENISKFSIPEQRSLAQILINFSNKRSKQDAKNLADKIEQELKNGKDFAELAKKYSDDYTAAQGGASGWFGKKDLPSDVLSAPVFNLNKIGKVTNPIEFNNNIYIFKLLGVKPGKEQSLSDVKSEIQQDLQQKMREEKFAEIKTQLEDKLYDNQSLAEISKSMNLPLKTSGYFTRKGGSSEVTANTNVILAAFSNEVINEKETSNIINLDENNIVVLSGVDHIPPQKQSFDEVKSKVIQDLKIQKAQFYSQEKANKTLSEIKNLKDSSELKNLAAKNNWKIFYRTNIAVNQISTGDAEISSTIYKDIFYMPRSKNNMLVLKETRDAEGNYQILILQKVLVPDVNKAPQDKLDNIKKQFETLNIMRSLYAVVNNIQTNL